MTPEKEHELRRLHLSNRSRTIMPIYTIGGAAVGALLISLIWVAQSQSPDGPNGPLWKFAILGAGLGVFIGYALGRERPRACPNCSKPMGKPRCYQGEKLARASRPENRCELVMWRQHFFREGGASLSKYYDPVGIPRVESYYLCEHCDLEFRWRDLEGLKEEGIGQDRESPPRAAKRAAKRKKKTPRVKRKKRKR